MSRCICLSCMGVALITSFAACGKEEILQRPRAIAYPGWEVRYANGQLNGDTFEWDCAFSFNTFCTEYGLIVTDAYPNDYQKTLMAITFDEPTHSDTLSIVSSALTYANLGGCGSNPSLGYSTFYTMIGDGITSRYYPLLDAENYLVIDSVRYDSTAIYFRGELQATFLLNAGAADRPDPLPDTVRFTNVKFEAQRLK